MKFVKKTIAAITAIILAFPTALSAAAEDTAVLSGDTLKFYDYWKNKYVTQDTYVTDETQYYVYYNTEKYSGNGVSVPVTVSEAHGYGMLIMASMADYDDKAKEYFDGMYRYFKAHPSDIGPNLMSWQQCDNGAALIDGATDGSMQKAPCDSATDGDMDIAYALLLADKVWGSDGDIDYLSEAKAVINDIMKYEVNHEFWTMSLGDWVSECDKSEKYYHATRSSDFIVQYMPVFAEVTGDDNWMKVYDTTYQIIEELTAEYGNGILPDFIVRDSSGKFVASEPNFLESEYDGYYSYNSCRTPWRISVDYLINKNEKSKKFAENITAFISEKTNGDAWEIMAGYKPDGTAIEDYNDLCFVSPFLIAAKCTDNIKWHDAVREVSANYGEDVYYGDTITMLCLITDDGGWIVPKENGNDEKIGDINRDGLVNLMDITILQKYLLKIDILEVQQFEIADINNDGKINAFDFVSLKRLCYLD